MHSQYSNIAVVTFLNLELSLAPWHEILRKCEVEKIWILTQKQ